MLRFRRESVRRMSEDYHCITTNISKKNKNDIGAIGNSNCSIDARDEGQDWQVKGVRIKSKTEADR
jgi:hypothetical protein